MTLIFVLLTFGITLFVLWPLFMGSYTYRAHRSKRDELVARRDVLLQEMRDLEVERAMGKMDETTYREVCHRLESELAEVLVGLEALEER